MADIENNWGDYSPGSSENSSTVISKNPSNNALDKDAFLKLLVTQFQYQDPLNPVDDKQFIAQMAQFTALEQMQNLNTSYSKSQAFSMIGRMVEAVIVDPYASTKETIFGTVNSVSMKNGVPYLMIGAKEVSLDDVTKVGKDVITDSINNNLLLSQMMDLVGKYVQAITVDSQGNPKGFIEGKVDYVRLDGDVPVLVVGENEVLPYEIASVGTQPLLLGRSIEADIYVDGAIKRISGTVDKVTITSDGANLVVGGEIVPIETINWVTEALSLEAASRLEGKEITHGTTTGLVEGVVIKFKQPYLIVAGKEIAYTEYKKIKSDEKEDEEDEKNDEKE